MKNIHPSHLKSVTALVGLVFLAVTACTCASRAADAAPTTAANLGGTPVEQALTRWRQGDQAGAIGQFLKIDWKATPVLSPRSALATREKDLPGMSASRREKLMTEVVASLRDLKQLASAVKEKATATAPKDPALAQSYLGQIQQCAAALDTPEALKILQLTAQSLRKLSAGEAKKS